MGDLALVMPLDRPDLDSLPLDLLREHRAELLAECARAEHWRRIVQAHLDLAVHATAPVEVLHDRALRESLASAVPTCGDSAAVTGEDRVVALRRMEAAKAQLTGYGSGLRTALREATDELVDRYRRTPTACLQAP